MTATTKRKVPRKAPAKRTTGAATNGHATNGAEANGAKAGEDFAAGVADQTVRPPEEFVPVEPTKPAHPYGTTPVYTFKPTDGSAPIIFPVITTASPDKHFFWKIRRKDPLFQAYDWMDLLKVPEEIQERVWKLSDAECARFLQGWYLPITSPQGVGVPGES